MPENRHSVWHEDNRGDWRVAYFDVPVPTRLEATDFQERVEKEFKRTVKNWAAMLQAEDCEPTTAPILNPNVYYCPEPDKQGYRRFYMAARVKRLKPELLPVDSAAQIAGVGHVDQQAQMRDFFEQMHGFQQGVADPDQLEKQAQDLKSLPARAERERKETKRWRQ